MEEKERRKEERLLKKKQKEEEQKKKEIEIPVFVYERLSLAQYMAISVYKLPFAWLTLIFGEG